jgi:hypothetical protein
VKRTLVLPLLLVAFTAAPTSSSDAGKPPDPWDGATPLHFARPTKRCEGVRAGDRVRLSCAKGIFVAGFRLAGGSAEGVTLEGGGREHGGAYATFPVRPGDRRLFVIDQLGENSGYTVQIEAYAVISEVWTEGEPEPTITVD